MPSLPPGLVPSLHAALDAAAACGALALCALLALRAHTAPRAAPRPGSLTPLAFGASGGLAALGVVAPFLHTPAAAAAVDAAAALAAGALVFLALRREEAPRRLQVALAAPLAVAAALAASAPWAPAGSIAWGLAHLLRVALPAVATGWLLRAQPPADRNVVAGVQQHAEALDAARAARELEGKLEAARASAEAANRAKDEFLAMLGHELRNPLAPIVTALRIMKTKGLGPHEREHAVVERQVAHVARLVEDLLDVSRLTRGRVELKPQRLELATAVDDAVAATSALLRERGQRLAIDVPRDGLPLDADGPRLVQVIANLLSNAAKYSAPGSAIELRAGRRGACVELSVCDEGIGVPPDLLPRVFDLFVQGRRTIDRADGGLGLGLTIVRRLVELHGGSVTAASAGPGRGSTFTISLPAAPVVEAAPAAAPAPARAGTRVLIVDDNRDAAELLAEALTFSGHDTRLAHDGPTALELAETFQPEVGLLDIGLPVMDGYDLARRLRAIPGGGAMKLVALTGYGQESDRRLSREAGFDEHLVKPTDLDALEATITRLVQAQA